MKNRLRPATFALCATVPFGTLLAFSQTAPASPPPSPYSFTISASQPWTDTGVDLSAGDTLSFTAEAASGADSTCAPQGATAPSSSDKLPLSDAPAGALIAKTSDQANPVLVGGTRDLHIDAAGHLFLGLNQTTKSDCSFAVKLSINRAQAATTAAAQPHSMKDQLSSAAKVWIERTVWQFVVFQYRACVECHQRKRKRSRRHAIQPFDGIENPHRDSGFRSSRAPRRTSAAGARSSWQSRRHGELRCRRHPGKYAGRL